MRANTVFLLALFGFCAISFSSANRWDAMRGINAVDERASSTSADSDADAETEAAAERPRPNSAVPKTLRKMIENGYKDWTAYKNYHGKTSYDEEMEKERMLSFFSAQQHVEKHNAIYQRGDASFEVGLTSVADLPYSDYKKLNGYRPLMGDVVGRKNSSKFLTPMNIDVPESVDWRDHGYVTDVKNQGLCGSCWAFSTTGSLEGQHMRATKNLVSLSEQNLVDCSTAYGNNGCNGGLMDFAFQYIKDNHGIDTETSYPYKAKERVCHFKKEAVGADDTGFVDLPKGDEEALKAAVATQGPISVAIDAGHRSFQLYHKGVYYEKECSADQLDHGVLVVGYGTDPVHGDYWIVKNSWGTNWGENGYVRMARNRNNHCGIASSASYPLV